MKVIPIRDPGPSVENVVKDISEHVPNLRSVCAVGVTDEGEIICWASGHAEDIATAALTLDDYAKAVIKGLVSYESDT